jgi:putative PEP-CTERM system integral membrane protein
MSDVRNATQRQYDDLCARIPHTTIMERVREEIHVALANRGTDLPKEASVFFDDVQETVVVLLNGEVLTGDLAKVASESGKNTLRLLWEETATEPTLINGEWKLMSGGGDTRNNKVEAFFFWGLNGIILLYWCIWFVGFVFSPAFREWYSAASEASDFGIQGLLLFLLLPAIPLIATTSAVLAKHGMLSDYKHGRVLWQFEIPTIISAFVVNMSISFMPLTEELRTMFITLFLVILTYWYMVTYRIQTPSRIGTLSRHILGSITATIATYIILLTVVPTYLAILEEVVPGFFTDELFEIIKDPFTALVVLFYIVLVLAPLGILFVFARTLRNTYRDTYLQLSASSVHLARGILFGIPTVFIALLFAFSWQYSAENYDEQLVLLARDEGGYASQSARARELVLDKDAVDSALRDKLFARKQYLFTKSELSRSYSAPLTMGYLRFIAFPFVYDDKSVVNQQGDQYQALAQGYERAYGENIQVVNQKTAEPRKQVHLLSRDVHVLTNGSPVFSTVTITDSLGTFLPNDQEVVYEFSLPEHAVITDLRLGTSLEHRGEIAPRGAAQQTYVNQVRRMVDPALLEQTGPRQYRLRVYPVPGVSQNAERIRREAVEGPTQRVQFTYVVVRDPEGIPLPSYTQEFNLSRNDVQISAQIDGKKARLAQDGSFVIDPKDKELLCALRINQVTTLPDGVSVRFVLSSDVRTGGPALELCDNADATFALFQHKKIAFLVDTSYANKEQLGGLLEQVRALPDTFFRGNTVRYYPFGAELGAGVDIKSPSDMPKMKNMVFFGKGDIVKALGSIDAQFDTVIIFVGEKPYFSDAQILKADARTHANVIFIHPKGMVPAYPTAFETLVANARGVSVVTDIQSALAHSGAIADGSQSYSYVGSYWYIKATSPQVNYGNVMPTSTPIALTGATSMDGQKMLFSIAERAQITKASRMYRSGTIPAWSLVTSFDALHGRAKSIGIVTPLSSYIALVNDNQRNQLSALSGHVDKYTSEQSFTVTQPGFVAPLMTSGFRGGGFGQQSLGLSGSVTSSAAPTYLMPTVSGGDGGGYYDNTLSNPSPASTGVKGEMFLPQIIILIVTFLLLGGGVYATYRILRRTHKV